MAKEKAEKKAAEPKKEKAAAEPKKEKATAEAKAEKHAADAAHDHDHKDEKGHGHGKEKKHHEPKAPKPEHKAWHAKSKPREQMRCEVKNCKRRYRAKGYCVSHYREWRHGKFGKQRYTSCTANNCTKPMGVSRQGYCEDHWIAVYKKGESVSAKVVEAAPEKEAKAKESAA